MSAPMRASVGAAAATRDLWQLAETDDTTGLEQILLRGADINAVNSAGTTVLMRAAYHGCAQMVKVLIERGADLNATRSDRFNPLMLAAFFGHADVVKVLVKCGADLNGVTRSNTSAEMWATARSFFDIADYLRDARNALEENSASERFVVQARESATTQEVASYDPPFVAELEKIETAEEGNTCVPAIVTQLENVANTREVNTFHQPIVREPEKEPEYTLKKVVRMHHDGLNPPEAAIEPLTVPVVRTLKEPPEIWDLVHETPPQFNPGSAFITRLTSSTANLVIVGLLVFLVSSISVYGFLKLRRHPMLKMSSGSVSVSDKHAPASAVQPPVANATSPTAASYPATEVEAATPSLVENKDVTGQPQDANVLSIPARKTSHAGRGSLLTSKEIKPNSIQDSPSNSSSATLAASKVTAEPSAAPRSGDRENTAASSSKKAPPTTLSPQLIAPSTSASPTRKAKVIQWP